MGSQRETARSTVRQLLVELRASTRRSKTAASDLAERFFTLEKTHGVAREDLCAQTGLARTYVDNLIRAWGQLGAEARKAWKVERVPMATVLRLAKFEKRVQEVELAGWRADRVMKKLRRKLRSRGEYGVKSRPLVKTNGVRDTLQKATKRVFAELEALSAVEQRSIAGALATWCRDKGVDR